MLASPLRWYDCIAETDPYGPRHDGVYVGPIGAPQHVVTVPWPSMNEQGPKVFAYLRDEADVSECCRCWPKRRRG